MSLNIFAFRDKKSMVLSNHFISAEPWEKIKQNISVSLFQLSVKDKTNPFVLFASDYDLVHVGSVDDEMLDLSDTFHENCANLLLASQKAFNAAQNHTSPTATSENDLE